MLKTKNGLPKYCGWFHDRHGKRRVRFRKANISTFLTGTPWSEGFMRQYATALDSVQEQTKTIGSERTMPGTVNALCAAYYKSADFYSLKASTQAHRRRIIERFRAEYGDLYLKGLKRHHIEDIIAAKAKDTPEAANNLVKILRVMLNYAVTLNMIPNNPITGMRRYKSHGTGHHPWTEEEINQFETMHAIGSKARLAQALLLYTGQRVGDVARMGWQHLSGDAIAVRQEKTGTPLLLPLHPELKAMLAALPKTNLTFVVTARGAAFTAQGLSAWFKEQCREAGLPHCSAHGLRHANATRLANAGAGVNQIAAFTGHKSLREVARYTAKADQARLAQQALRLQLGAESEQELSNLRTQIVKPRAKQL
jgi:integrase